VTWPVQTRLIPDAAECIVLDVANPSHRALPQEILVRPFNGASAFAIANYSHLADGTYKKLCEV
jgi:hypothetical protein